MSDPLLLNVFLSYARDDLSRVSRFYKKLKKEGWISPWLDEEDLSKGAEWEIVIQAYIEDEAHIVLVFLSNCAIEKSGYFQKEVRLATEKAQLMRQGGIFVIPVLLDKCEIPQILKKYNWVDYINNNQKDYKRLIVTLKNKAEEIGISTSSPPQKLLVIIYLDIEYKYIRDVEIKASELLFLDINDIIRLSPRKKGKRTIELLVEMTARTLHDMEVELENKLSDLYTVLKYQTHRRYKPDPDIVKRRNY